MRDEFLPRSLDRLLATCRPQKDLPARASAKGYANKDDKKGAFLQTPDWEKSAESYCPSQGSWYLSAESLALFGRNLLYTDRWVSPATRRLMFDPANSGEEFPWAGTVRHDDFGKEMGQSTWPSHGGSQGGYKAALVQLPYGYVGAALINSADRESDQIAKTLMDAFYAGTRGKAISRTKHGITPSAYQAYVWSWTRAGTRSTGWISTTSASKSSSTSSSGPPARAARTTSGTRSRRRSISRKWTSRSFGMRRSSWTVISIADRCATRAS